MGIYGRCGCEICVEMRAREALAVAKPRYHPSDGKSPPIDPRDPNLEGRN
jgi:hypothetical protein